LVDDNELATPAEGYVDDSRYAAVAVRLPMVMFGLRAAALAGLVVAAGLGAGDMFFDIDTTDVNTTTCCPSHRL
jgi:uncharacterized membrane protein